MVIMSRTKTEIIETLNATELDGLAIRKKTVTYSLVDAEVVFVKSYTSHLFRDLSRANRGMLLRGVKIIVKDPVLGSVFFQSTSDKFNDVERGDKISLVVTLTGVGTPSEKYPDPIMFAKANTRKRDSVVLTKKDLSAPSADDDISVNV
jgi:hypothetical protein